jgi:hypothetical protein
MFKDEASKIADLAKEKSVKMKSNKMDMPTIDMHRSIQAYIYIGSVIV